MEIDFPAVFAKAAQLSKLCPPSDTAFSVGAIVFDAEGNALATGYSRETGPLMHAEEVALAKAREAGKDVRGGTMVCSLEPCGERLSKPISCADLIIKAGISTVVYAAAEPGTFIKKPIGAEKLKQAGVQVLFFL